MQPFVDAPVVEVHEDQQVDHSLAQLQQDVQEQLQQHQFSSSAEQPAAASSSSSSPSASMHTAADDSSRAAAAPAEAAADEAAPTPAAAEPAAAAADVPASTLMTSSKPASSCGDDAEWHLVSPNGSVRLRGGSTSSRTSFDYTGCGASSRIGSDADAADAAAGMLADDAGEGLTVRSCCSGSDTETSHTPKDDLAASILGHSVLTHGSHFGSATAAEDAAAAAAEMQGSDDGMEALRAASMLSSEGGLNGLAAAEAPVGADDGLTTAAEDGAAAGLQQGAVDAEVLTGLGLLGGEVAQLVGAAQGKAAVTLQGLREWLVESLAALVQSGRASHAACLSTSESIQRSLHILAKQGGIAAAAVGAAADWRLVLSSAAAVVCLAMWMRSRNEAATLRASLRRRDHELSKLVMRLVSLQELLNQGQALPLNRYMRYEGAATVAAAASYM